MKAGVFTADGRLSTKARRAAVLRKAAGTAPAPYRSTTTKEELCFEYINSFLSQFSALYPKRRLPWMMAINEFGVKKFVSTTIRPTKVPFSELYDMYECASFLAGYVLFEPLDPPFEPPTLLFSPTQTLDAYTGDAFDLSTLLCSFLTGAGYDAYVVYGYAPEFITKRDQSRQPCPIVGASSSASSSSSSSSSSSAHSNANTQSGRDDEDTDNPYKPIDNSTKHSVFLADQATKAKEAERDDFVLWLPDAETGADGDGSSSTPTGENKRVHAWVLVCAGQREVKESVFIEASTGRVYSTTNSPYIGIEAVWSCQNYFVNMQGFNGTKRVSEMTFDMANTAKWECLFTSGGSSSAAPAPDSPPHEQQDELEEAEPTEPDIHRTFDAPLTWVNPLVMDRPRYLLRFPPTGKRTIAYSRAKASYFARGVSPQAMTVRIVQYLDNACTQVKEIHEWFENRSDKLYKRSRFLLNGAHTVEHYHPGSVGEVKTWTMYPAKLIAVDFYVDGRLDRLYRREEHVGSKIAEFFHARGDLLSTRVVYITPDKAVAGPRQFSLPGQGLAPELYILKVVSKYEADPVKLAQTSPLLGAQGEDQVAKHVFFIREGKLITTYHFPKSRVTGKMKTYLHTRGPSIPMMTEQALAQQLGLEEDPALLQEAAGLERECFASVKMSVQAFDSIVQARLAVETRLWVPVDKSVFDAALDSVQKVNALTAALTLSQANSQAEAVASATGGAAGGAAAATLGRSLASGGATASLATLSQASEEEKSGGRVDYLAPFMRGIRDPHCITKEEALEVRQTCLDSYKARLVERANIIQARLNEENAKLSRKQEQFQRSQREGDMSTEEYEKYCTEAMFRIQILEQRLASHEDAALKKFKELDMRLAADPRLIVLKSSDR